jgi:hypothetical protein
MLCEYIDAADFGSGFFAFGLLLLLLLFVMFFLQFFS